MPKAGGMKCAAVYVVLLEFWSIGTLASGSGVKPPEQCGGVPVSDWLSATWQARGYHVLCFNGPAQDCSEADSADDAESCRASSSSSQVACWRGHQDNCEDLALAAPASLLELELAIVEQASLQNPRRYERIKKAKEKKGSFPGLFAFFSVGSSVSAPTRITKPQQLSGLVLAFEGGAFIWPGISPGFRRNITLTPDGGEALKLELLTRSLDPLIVEVSSFLTESECKHIIDKASPHIKRSAVSHMDHDVGKPDTDWRSSSTYFMPSDDDQMRQLDARVASLVVAPVNHQEYAQVLRYGETERYAAHHDYFDPNMYKKSEQIMSMTNKGLFNRIATVFFYLSTVEEGGQTNFPRAGGLPQPRSFEDCSKGISVDPVQGRIIIFYSMDPAAIFDELSLHGGCAVKNGVKWSANKWIWNKKMNFLK